MTKIDAQHLADAIVSKYIIKVDWGEKKYWIDVAWGYYEETD